MKTIEVLEKVFVAVMSIILITVLVSAIWGCRWDEATVWLLAAICMKLNTISDKLS